ncbi:MAG: hypothetical protein JST31_14325 [Actinobacteria bacterium]|nr:hypothetical protein [Actinomycetota bacterium]
MRAGAEAALVEFRRTRRRRYVEELDVMEILYRVYVGAIFAAIALGVLAGALHEAPASAAALDSIRVHAPPIFGIAVALGVLAGLRSGAHGGPLAIEPAEVQYTLLAPLDRSFALRPKALSQLRIAAIAGAVTGAVVGNFVFRRFPGSPVEWIAGLALFGALVPVAVLGAAMLASGRRLRPLLAGGAGVALVLWSVADLALGSTTSPTTMLGELATLPLQHGARIVLAGVGAVLALALVGAGLLRVGGILLEAARRRAALAAELRFTASVGDLRTVILLRRQLASERPRRRPWLRIGAGAGRPVWRRGWQSFMRWPLVRIARVLVLALAAGAVAVAAWKASIVLFVVPGVLLFVAALDLIEPLAQESDHPTRFELLPADTARLFRRHLAAPTAALVAVVLLAAAAAAAIAGDPLALGIGLVLAFPLGLVLACCAGFSATNDPFRFAGMTPGVGYGVAAAPLLVAAVAVGLPLLAARALWLHGSSPFTATISLGLILLGVAWVAALFLGELVAKRTAVQA